MTKPGPSVSEMLSYLNSKSFDAGKLRGWETWFVNECGKSVKEYGGLSALQEKLLREVYNRYAQ